MQFIYIVTYLYTPVNAYIDKELADQHAQAIGGEVYAAPLFPSTKYIVGPGAVDAD